MNGCVYRTAEDKCEFYSDYGKGIMSYCDFADCEDKKPSNADKIRAMTDEELAEFIKADIIRSLVSLHISWISDFDAAVKEEWLARKRKEEGET